MDLGNHKRTMRSVGARHFTVIVLSEDIGYINCLEIFYFTCQIQELSFRILFND